ncbi:hypothetical protein N7491_006423 [Penicillium cf. griseofulvum]|nr:hypothetical protein N7491_006423 [Penicillium cf. griseofulvum]
MRRIININLTSTFVCAPSAAREISEQGFLPAWYSSPRFETAAYISSKAGVHHVARHLASEWRSLKGGPVIRINSLSPGYTRTRMTEDLLKYPMQERLMSEGSMLNRISATDKYRGPVMFYQMRVAM